MFYTIILMYFAGQKSMTKTTLTENIPKIWPTVASKNGTAKSLLIGSVQVKFYRNGKAVKTFNLKKTESMLVIIFGCTTFVFGLSCKCNFIKLRNFKAPSIGCPKKSPECQIDLIWL